MTVWVRLWNCGVCGGPVYFDDDKATITCECGTVHVNVPMPHKHRINYHIMPYVAEILKPNPFKDIGVTPVDVMKENDQ